MALLKSELREAWEEVETLRLCIDQSKARARERKQKLEAREIANGASSSVQLTKLLQELESKKRELGDLRLDMASVLEEIARAELGKEIEQANEERALLEIARTEAIKETKEIAARIEAEAASYSRRLKEAKAGIAELKKKVSQARKLEQKLAVTTAEIDIVQNEIMLLRAIEKKSSYKSQQFQLELEGAKKELAEIKEGAFRYMASMDVAREEMRHVLNEASRLRRVNEEADMKVKDLNFKLLHANSEMEIAEKKMREAMESVLLSASLRSSQEEQEKARKEWQQILEEIEDVRGEIWASNLSIDASRDELVTAMRELGWVKSREAAALVELRSVCERTMNSRVCCNGARSGVGVSVSRFEYDYLRNCAAGARDLARKKVEAAEAWVEAFVQSKKEVQLQARMIQLELEEVVVVADGAEEEEEEEENRKGLNASEHQELVLGVVAPAKRNVRAHGNNIPNSRRTSLHRRSMNSTSQAQGHASAVGLRRRRTALRHLAKLLVRKT